MPQPSRETPGERIAALDLIRGVAVLGILAINMAGFAGPSGATLSPHIPAPASPADEAIFAFNMVVFEGKMRAIFTLLFGAGIALYVDRAEAAGRDGDVLQLRRLGWLVLLGYLHFLLLWWGDILLSYGMVGVAALFMRELPVRRLLTIALVIFGAWHLGGAIESAPGVLSEERVRAGIATSAETEDAEFYAEATADKAADEVAEARLGFFAQVAAKLAVDPMAPINLTIATAGEALPLMLLGMVLYRTGFFTGGWSRLRLRRIALLSIALGLAATLPVVAWLWVRHFPPQPAYAAMVYWLALPHLLMAWGYLAALMLVAPRLAPTALGRRLIAAGRMAFSNYVGTSLVMCAIFYGWGLGLAGSVDRLGQTIIMLGAWTLMLAWSQPWLAHFRQGPLEWLWRSLTEKRLVAFRR